MRTVLIPVDFSDTTENVLKYAADFCMDTKVERVILLKCCYVSVYEQLLPSADFVQLSADDIDEERKSMEAKLKAASHNLLKRCNPSIKIQTALSELSLVRAVHQLIEDENPNLVMIGSDKTSDESNNRSAEQIIAIAKTSNIPVLIVPNTVKYERIELALVPCNFAAVSSLDALKGFHDRQKWIHPKLMVLSIDPKQRHLSADEHLAAGLVDMLDGFDYNVYYSEDKDTVHGILSFARANKVHLIIALPGKYSFFYNLTHRSITNALALNAVRPVLILK